MTLKPYCTAVFHLKMLLLRQTVSNQVAECVLSIKMMGCIYLLTKSVNMYGSHFNELHNIVIHCYNQLRLYQTA